MAYVFGIILVLFIIGTFSSRNTLTDGAKQVKSRVSQLMPASDSSQSDLLELLSNLHVEGCLYGPMLTELKLLDSPALSRQLQSLSRQGWLEQVLPRLGFSIRSASSLPELTRGHARFVITPNGHAVGYTPSSDQ